MLCQRLRLSRPLAAGLVYVASMMVVVVAGILAAPVLMAQIAQLAKAVPGYVAGFARYL